MPVSPQVLSWVLRSSSGIDVLPSWDWLPMVLKCLAWRQTTTWSSCQPSFQPLDEILHLDDLVSFASFFVENGDFSCFVFSKYFLRHENFQILAPPAQNNYYGSLKPTLVWLLFPDDRNIVCWWISTNDFVVQKDWVFYLQDKRGIISHTQHLNHECKTS